MILGPISNIDERKEHHPPTKRRPRSPHDSYPADFLLRNQGALHHRPRCLLSKLTMQCITCSDDDGLTTFGSKPRNVRSAWLAPVITYRVFSTTLVRSAEDELGEGVTRGYVVVGGER